MDNYNPLAADEKWRAIDFTTKIYPYRMVPPHQENFPTQADLRLIVAADEKWRAIELAQRMYGQFADAEKLILEAEKILKFVLGG